MKPMNKKEWAEIIWAVVAMSLGVLFSFTQVLPDFGGLAGSNLRFAIGLSLGACSGATFFLMGLPVIDALACSLRNKGVL